MPEGNFIINLVESIYRTQLVCKLIFWIEATGPLIDVDGDKQLFWGSFDLMLFVTLISCCSETNPI